jgi:hypothetical protein
MTRYEQGFLTKCAEYGIDGRELLYKQALLGSSLNKVLRKIKRFYTYPGKIRHNISKAIEGGISEAGEYIPSGVDLQKHITDMSVRSDGGLRLGRILGTLGLLGGGTAAGIAATNKPGIDKALLGKALLAGGGLLGAGALGAGYAIGKRKGKKDKDE